MPFGLQKHSNRSKQALNDPALQVQGNQGTALPSTTSGSGGSSESYQTYFVDGPAPDAEQSQSKRYSNTYPLVGNNASTDDLQIFEQGRRNSAQALPVEHKKGKSFFDRLKSGPIHSQAEHKTLAPSYNNTGGLARRLSQRQENLPTIRTVQRDSFEQSSPTDRKAVRNSAYLPSPRESLHDEDNSGLDPYLIRGSEAQQQIQTDQEVQRQRFSADDYEQPQLVAQKQADYQEGVESPQHHIYQSQSPTYYRHHPNISSTSMSLDLYRRQQPPNPETISQVSQLSYESPIDQEQRPISVQSGDTFSSQYPSRTSSIQQNQGPAPSSMPPPASTSSQRRQEIKQSPSGAQVQQEARDMPPSYRQSYSGNPSTPMGPISTSAGSQPPNYSRGGSGQGHPYGNPGGSGDARGTSEQGRSTPPPAPSERDIGEAYKELSQKYKKVKGLYFDKTLQVEQLQNTLANQRLSQSRTSLDDNEYMTRFQRLDGAITNLAFNIRKDWKAIPSWLAHHVNPDAMRIGRQEMTAIGRACISYFLVNEIFSRSFHPGLDTDLSSSLKAIEQNIRRFSPAMNSQEESDALTSKVVQWRLSTLDGLRDALNSPESEECRRQFSIRSTIGLTAHLSKCLVDPAPAGIEDSAHMIVELAVSIASNMPLESRDISVIYPMPSDMVVPFVMKVETGLPPLENLAMGDASSEVDASSTGSGDKDDLLEKEKGDGKIRKEKPKGPGMLSAMMGGGQAGQNKKMTSPGGKGDAGVGLGGGDANKTEDLSQRVRFAGFIGVEVRGRQVLFKAPVWTVA